MVPLRVIVPLTAEITPTLAARALSPKAMPAEVPTAMPLIVIVPLLVVLMVPPILTPRALVELFPLPEMVILPPPAFSVPLRETPRKRALFSAPVAAVSPSA